MVKTYEVWGYDVWGNAKDGFDVNDRSRIDTIAINVKGETYNQGTANEFTTFEPSDLQLARALNVRGCEFENSGDGVIYVTKKSNGRPEGELVEIK